MGDTCRQVSWLAARARRLHLPAGCRQWLLGRRSPLTVAGAAAALRPCGPTGGLAPRSLFTAAAFRETRGGRDETVTRSPSSGRDARLSIERRQINAIPPHMMPVVQLCRALVAA